MYKLLYTILTLSVSKRSYLNLMYLRDLLNVIFLSHPTLAKHGENVLLEGRFIDFVTRDILMISLY